MCCQIDAVLDVVLYGKQIIESDKSILHLLGIDRNIGLHTQAEVQAHDHSLGNPLPPAPLVLSFDHKIQSSVLHHLNNSYKSLDGHNRSHSFPSEFDYVLNSSFLL